MTCPQSCATKKTLYTDFPVPPVDLDFGYRTGISGRREVLDITDAPSSDDIIQGGLPGRGPFLPLGESGQTPQKLGASLVIEMANTKIERVGTDECRQLIEEAFIGETVLHATWHSDPGPAEWCLGEEMRYGLNVWESVRNCRVDGQIIGEWDQVRLRWTSRHRC
jgi:hypothetical protein